MASSISDMGEGTGLRTLRVLLESASDGTASYTTDSAKPVSGKAYSWKVIPFTDSYQPSNNFSVTIKDSDNISVVRSPAALSAAVSNSTPAEATVLDAAGLTAPYVIGNKVLTFAASGMGSGKKAYVELCVIE